MTYRGEEDIRKAIRKKYGRVARYGAGDTGCCSSSCCGGNNDTASTDLSVALGYSVQQLSRAPQAANMGLGCGNPLAIASLKPGETVLDIGSGGGFDAFLAAQAVGETGRVIGVDATPEMVHKARRLAAANGYANVEFHLGAMENLPLPRCSVDAIISNCVINLSTEKSRVFQEAFRVLKPGGRLAVSDVVASAELPDEMADDLALYASCIAGACTVDEIEGLLRQAGFTAIDIAPKEDSKTFIREWAPDVKAEEFVVSAIIQASRPS